MTATGPAMAAAEPVATESAAARAGTVDLATEQREVRVRAHPGLCAGWGNCHRFAPEVYPLDDEGHLAIHLLAVPAEHAHAARVGASVCPEQAISVVEVRSP